MTQKPLIAPAAGTAPHSSGNGARRTRAPRRCAPISPPRPCVSRPAALALPVSSLIPPASRIPPRHIPPRRLPHSPCPRALPPVRLERWIFLADLVSAAKKARHLKGQSKLLRGDRAGNYR